VDHGRNGLLVAPDDPAALAEALNQLLADEGAMVQMGKQGKEMAESRCRANVVAEQTLTAYRNVIADWNKH
jgi:glycosyltransferase involved in cell wall biosynthesis